MGNLSDENGPRKAGFFATVKAVLWSFIGIRKRKDYQFDASSLNPIHVIIAGIIGGVLFVLTLVLVVRLIVSQ